MVFIRLNNFRKELKDAMVQAPVELVVSVVFFIAAVVSFSQNQEIDNWLWAFPACFSLVYAVNRSIVRWVYYLSVLSILAFERWSLEIDSSIYWITLVISQLIVLLSVKQNDNHSFVENALGYAGNLIGAILLSLLGWLLTWGIYRSVVYIFDLPDADHFMNYAALTAFFLMAPLLFLMFQARRKEGFKVNAFFGVLINFIVSPALLVYNLILYIYILKIAWIWTLPKGGIAYLVLSFAALLWVSKAVQLVLRRRYYDWYYNYFSWWILPALVLLWISALQRVGEYGWTEWRVYLMLMVLIVTATTLLFFNSRWRKYKGVVWMVVGMFMLFTYIPGMNAEAWGVRSQENRMRKSIQFLYIQNGNRWTENSDSLSLKYYKTLQSSVYYVQRFKTQEYMLRHFGFTADDFFSLIPEKARNLILGNEENPVFWLNLCSSQEFNITNFDSLLFVSPYPQGDNLYYSGTDGYLVVGRKQDTLLQVDLNPLFRERLVENGIDTTGVLDRQRLEEMKHLFQEYRLGEKKIILDNIRINADKVSIEDVDLRFLLIRKK